MSYRHTRINAQEFRNLLQDNWTIIWKVQENVKRVFVTLMKKIQGHEIFKKLIVGAWALPVKDKQPKNTSRRNERRGQPKNSHIAAYR